MAEGLMEFGYAAWARKRDVAFLFVFALITTGLAFPLAYDVFILHPSYALMSIASLWIIGVLVAGQARWSSRGRLTDRGIGLSAGPDGPWTELGWDALEEIHLLEAGGIALSGAGTRVRVTGNMDGAPRIRDRILREQGPLLFHRLREAYRRGEALEFRGPQDPERAFVISLCVLFFMGVPMILALAHGVFAFVPMLGIPLFLLPYREAVQSQAVVLDRRGLRRRRAFRTLEVPWESIRAAELHTASGTLVVSILNGGAIMFPPTLSNFVVLQELVLAGPPPAS